MPASRLRSTSLRTTTAPGTRPISGASFIAIVVLPLPDRPPIASRRGGAGSRKSKRHALVGPRAARVAVADQRRARGIDEGADAGAARQEHRQQRQRLVMRRLWQLGDAPQPFVEQPVGERLQLALAEVHQREGRGRRARRCWRCARRTLWHRTAPACRRSARCCAGAGRHGSGDRAGPDAARHQIDIRLRAPRACSSASASLVVGIEPLALLAHLADVGRDRVAIVVGPAEAVADRRAGCRDSAAMRAPSAAISSGVSAPRSAMRSNRPSSSKRRITTTQSLRQPARRRDRSRAPAAG